MKMHHFAVAAAALISSGAFAGAEQHSQSREGTVRQSATDAATIREAQERLRDAGYPATPQGLKEFQQSKGIEASGRLDQQTLAALGVGASASSGATGEGTKN